MNKGSARFITNILMSELYELNGNKHINPHQLAKKYQLDGKQEHLLVACKYRFMKSFKNIIKNS